MLTHLSAAKLAAKIREKEVSTVEVSEAYLKAISDNDPKYRCFLTVDEEAVMAQARAAEDKINVGEAGPLTGVPIAVKDNMSTRGLRTTAGSKILDSFRGSIWTDGRGSSASIPAIDSRNVLNDIVDLAFTEARGIPNYGRSRLRSRTEM